MISRLSNHAVASPLRDTAAMRIGASPIARWAYTPGEAQIPAAPEPDPETLGTRFSGFADVGAFLDRAIARVEKLTANPINDDRSAPGLETRVATKIAESASSPSAARSSAAAPKRIVASFTRDASGAIDISSINIAVAGKGPAEADAPSASAQVDLENSDSIAIINLDVSAMTDGAGDAGLFDPHIQIAYGSLSDIITAASELSAIKRRLTAQQEFINSLARTPLASTLPIETGQTHSSPDQQALLAKAMLRAQPLSIANQEPGEVGRLLV